MAKEVVISREAFERVLTGSHDVSTIVTSLPPQAISRGIQIVAYETNDDPIWLATRPSVTADDSSTGGFRLLPGAGIFVPAITMAGVFFVSTSASKFTYLGY